MKLSELRPCDNCGGIVAPQFYIVRSSLAIINPQSANATLGLTQMFGGHLALAEVMSPDADAVKIAGEFNKELWIELRLCRDCYMSDINLAEVAERNSDREATKQQLQSAPK